ncbi:response regulator [Neisseriaceae bacterium CLB008]|nr:response regulator transcription factor [Neisseriaceae bacterium]
MYTVLLVEDDVRLASLMAEYLSTYEFKVSIVDRGDRALSHFQTLQPDLVVLDLMLPGLDGMLVCAQIRAVSTVPILMLTAREDQFDEVLGLEQGADDYVNKPIQPRVLLARLRALLRRRQQPVHMGSTSTLAFGQLLIFKADRTVTWRRQVVDLSSSEYKLLITMADRAGETLGRDELFKKLRGFEFDGLDRSIDNHISRLRRKFDDEQGEKIKTVWGEGYLFCPTLWD